MMDYTNEFDALIFDCDGTLSDSMPLHFVAWRETLAKHGITFTEERFYQMGGMPSGMIVETLGREQSVRVDAVSVALEKEAAFVGMIDRVQPCEHICEIARFHHGRLPMAVASGSGREVVVKQLNVLGLDALFQTIVAAEDTQRHKPEPDVFLEAARRLGVAAQRCLVFEDSPLGFQAAEAAGMKWLDVRPAAWAAR
ncbi:HAD family hydrolase [Stieleria varia]|nr:HAD-IA family hydrolase [Stieleria varia]